MSSIIEVAFDATNNGFTFFGLVSTPAGLRLNVPYDPSTPTEIHIQKKNPPVSWNFEMISFRGPTGSQLILADAWKTVAKNETFPYTVADVAPVTLVVQSFHDDEIVLHDTNSSTQIDIGVHFQITILDTATGWWTSPDPQIINDKDPGSGPPVSSV